MRGVASDQSDSAAKGSRYYTGSGPIHPSAFILQEELPGKDSNLERGNQNLFPDSSNNLIILVNMSLVKDLERFSLSYPSSQQSLKVPFLASGGVRF